MDEQLTPIRRFYRKHLAQFALGRFAKRVYLVLRLRVLASRHFFLWHTSHAAHVMRVRVHARLHELSYNTSRFAHSSMEAASYHSRAGVHAAAYATRNGAQGGVYHGRRMLHWSVYWVIYSIRRGIGRLVMRVVAALAHVLAALCQRLGGGPLTFYSLRTFGEFRAATEAPSRTLAPAKVVELATPAVYPGEYRASLHSGPWQLAVPSVDVFEVHGAQIMGKSDFVFLPDECLHHGLYNFERDQLHEELHGSVSINADRGLIARFIGEEKGSLPAAISLVGCATSNYIHWLTETAPKLALLDQVDGYHGVPLVIDAGLHPNILESIQHLNTRGRELVTIGRGEMLNVEHLLTVSPVAYIPFDFKSNLKLDKLDIDPGFAMYSPDGLNVLRERLVTRLAGGHAANRRRLYLRRGAKSRLMTNASEIEALMEELGFEIVEPETLNFAQQVQLFSSAELIVGQGGAAFGNIIFAPVGCHVVILSTWSPYTIYYYFSNIASLLGQRCTYLLCEPVKDDNGHKAHMGLRVPTETLRQAIES